MLGLTDPLDRKLDYTLTGDDRTHVLQTNGSFDLPFGPNKLLLKNSSGALARVTEGWKLGWIFNLVSGPALDIQAANMLYGNGVPDIVGPFPFDKAGVRWGQDAGTYTGGNYFPTDAFRDRQRSAVREHEHRGGKPHGQLQSRGCIRRNDRTASTRHPAAGQTRHSGQACAARSDCTDAST